MRVAILFAILPALACTESAVAQDTTYQNAKYGPSTPDRATYYRVKARTDSGWRVSEYRMSGKPQSIINYKDDSLKVRQGEFISYNDKGVVVYRTSFLDGKADGNETYFYETGRLRATGLRKGGDYEGEWVGYFPSGKLAGKATFVHGKEVSGEFFHEDGSPNKEVTEFFHESTYPGGAPAFMRFLNKSIKYPKEAIKRDTQGTVVVQFVVNKDGTVSDLEVYKSADKYLDEEALRVLGLMSNWEPAMMAGIPLKSYKRQPIVFRF
ncbi:MAG: TonB family protein [Bacteroidota bacterium]|nr:TonB family protein [Bacteroidota bacterium]MDP4244788.1 TonB family protein [Bacteroidota bacterium]MDP4259323.1 TonB family protein [Bacteroidota bacterium]